jgi:putative tricarboxylic transport membrane protein
MKTDLIGGLVLLALAAAYFAATETIPSSMLDDDFGPRGLPVYLAALLGVLALLLIVRALVGLRAQRAQARLNTGAAANDEEEAGDDYTASLGRAFGFLLIGAGYLLLLPILGYPVAIAVAIAVIALYEGAARNWRIPVVAIGGGLGFWLLFNGLLGVAQPMGVLF